MSNFREHARTPRLPMTTTNLGDLARLLIEGRPGTVEYGDLAQLMVHGEDHNIDPRGITAARARLTAAAARGSQTAADLLDEIGVTA